MIRGLEFAGFVAVAAAVHAGILSVAPEGGGAGGDGGTDTVTLAASTPQMAALVAAWERPVPVQHAAPAPPHAPAPDAQPVALREGEAPRSTPTPKALPDTATAPRAPRIDTAPLSTPTPALTDRAPALAKPQDTAQETPQPQDHRTTAPRPATPDAPRAPQMAALPEIDHSPPAALAPPPPATRPQARPATKPAAKPAAPAPARRKETARGEGKQQAGGQASTAAPARIDDATRTSLMGQWGGAIRTRIERQKRYPAGTRASGTVHLVLDVGADGRLLGVGLRRSSGNDRLDAAAMNAVRSARLPAAPDRLPGTSHRFNLPVAFSR
ncbi:MAG: TonB family protein [Roseovarius sp.]|nr:TonB family protein [Roseovarius sp.]